MVFRYSNLHLDKVLDIFQFHRMEQEDDKFHKEVEGEEEAEESLVAVHRSHCTQLEYIHQNVSSVDGCYNIHFQPLGCKLVHVEARFDKICFVRMEYTRVDRNCYLEKEYIQVDEGFLYRNCLLYLVHILAILCRSCLLDLERIHGDDDDDDDVEYVDRNYFVDLECIL